MVAFLFQYHIWVYQSMFSEVRVKDFFVFFLVVLLSCWAMLETASVSA